jgi:Mrp family chromosome partitioning ATPase
MIRRATGNGKFAAADRACAQRAVLAPRFAALWQSVREACDATPLTIGVTACQRGSGATTVALNLAVTAARASWSRVALVEANFAAPILARTLGLAPAPGLADAVARRVSLSDCVQDTPIENLLLVAAGHVEPHAGPALGGFLTGALTNILAELARDCAVVVCDLPAASDASDALQWAARLDGTLLVVESGQQAAPLACQARQRLARSGARLLGAVLNKCPPPESAPLAPPRLTP